MFSQRGIVRKAKEETILQLFFSIETQLEIGHMELFFTAKESAVLSAQPGT